MPDQQCEIFIDSVSYLKFSTAFIQSGRPSCPDSGKLIDQDIYSETVVFNIL